MVSGAGNWVVISTIWPLVKGFRLNKPSLGMGKAFEQPSPVTPMTNAPSQLFCYGSECPNLHNRQRPIIPYRDITTR